MAKLRKDGEPKQSGGKREGSGQPMIEFDEKRWTMLEGLAAIFCTLNEAASLTGVSKPTLLEILDRERGQTWAEFFEEHSAKGKASLRRAQYKMATESNNATMQIWLGKQYLDQKDKTEVGFDPNQPAVFTLKMGRDLENVKKEANHAENDKEI